MLQPETEAENHRPSPLQSIALLLMYGNVDWERLDEPVLNLKKNSRFENVDSISTSPSLLIVKKRDFGLPGLKEW